MSNELFSYDVFLSYSSRDTPIVRSLAERLKSDGLRVWFDEWLIQPGDSIPAKIDHGLDHSNVLVLCISKNMLHSDWAILEAGTFRFRDPSNHDRRLIPLKLDATQVPGSLAQVRNISWTPNDRENNYQLLLCCCRRLSVPTQSGDSTTRNGMAVRADQTQQAPELNLEILLRLHSYLQNHPAQRATEAALINICQSYDYKTDPRLTLKILVMDGLLAQVSGNRYELTTNALAILASKRTNHYA